MHDEQQRQPDARTQQVLGRVRHIINKKNTQFILDHQHDSLAALSLYLRDCMEDIGHPPARVEVIGGDFLEYRFGSWQKALRSVYDGKADVYKRQWLHSAVAAFSIRDTQPSFKEGGHSQ